MRKRLRRFLLGRIFANLPNPNDPDVSDDASDNSETGGQEIDNDPVLESDDGGGEAGGA